MKGCTVSLHSGKKYAKKEEEEEEEEPLRLLQLSYCHKKMPEKNKLPPKGRERFSRYDVIRHTVPDLHSGGQESTLDDS